MHHIVGTQITDSSIIDLSWVVVALSLHANQDGLFGVPGPITITDV